MYFSLEKVSPQNISIQFLHFLKIRPRDFQKRFDIIIEKISTPIALKRHRVFVAFVNSESFKVIPVGALYRNDWVVR